MNSSGWKKIFILIGLNAVLVAVILLVNFWPSQRPQDLSLVDDNALFPVVLGPNKIINSPPPAFYQEKSLYKSQTKGLGFGATGSNNPVPWPAQAVLPPTSADPAKGVAETFSKSTLSAAMPAGFKSKLTARNEIFVFPPFYVKYLNEMQDIMAADGALKQKRAFKTNDDVVLFLDDFYDYLIAKGIVPKREESRLHSGIRRALRLLKDEAGVPQSYFIFPSQNKFADSRADGYGFGAFADFLSELSPVKPAQAQVDVLGFKITPEMGQKAGKFAGQKLGGLVGDKLGKFIPGSIANQLGNIIGSKVGEALGDNLSQLFTSTPSQIDSALRLQVAAEFGQVGSLTELAVSQELNSLYGPTIGSEIDDALRGQLEAEFGGLQESSFFGDLTKGLQDLLGSDFGKILGDLFGKFNDLSSVFSGFGSLESISSLIGGGGGGGGGDCYRSGLNDSGKKFVQNSCQINISKNQNFKDRFLAITLGLFQKILSTENAYAQGGGSNLPAPCCDCRTPKGQPLGCLNKVCPSGPAIWDQQTGICGCGGGGGGGGGVGAGIIGGIPSLGGAEGAISSLGLDKALGSLFKDAAGFFGLDAISPQLADMAGKFVAGQLGNLISNQLGKLIPGGIANQIGGFLSNAVGSQLGKGLSDIFASLDSGTMSPADARTAIDAEFGEVGSSIDSQLREQLNAEYGPIQGDYLYDQFNGELSATFTSDIEASFLDDTDVGVSRIAIVDKIESDQGGLLANGKGQEFLLPLSAQNAAAFENPHAGGSFTQVDSNFYLGSGLTDAQEKVVRNAVGEWKQVFNPDKTAGLDIVALNGNEIKSHLSSVYPDLTPQEIEDVSARALGFYLPRAGGTTLYLNTDQMVNFEGEFIPAEVGGWAVAESTTGVLEHETGHYFYTKVLTDQQRDAWVKRYEEAAVCGPDCTLSRYSFTGGASEAFAEAVNAVAKTGGDPTPFLVGRSPVEQQMIKGQYLFVKNLNLVKVLDVK